MFLSKARRSLLTILYGRYPTPIGQINVVRPSPVTGWVPTGSNARVTLSSPYSREGSGLYESYTFANKRVITPSGTSGQVIINNENL